MEGVDFAAFGFYFVSVPLDDSLSRSISAHKREFTRYLAPGEGGDRAGVVNLAQKMVTRCANAVRCVELDVTSRIGLIHWERESKEHFGRQHFVLKPEISSIPKAREFDVFDRPFDPSEFRSTHRAIQVDRLRDRKAFDGDHTRPLQLRQLLIRMPGTQFVIPTELNDFKEAAQRIINHFCSMKKDHE